MRATIPLHHRRLGRGTAIVSLVSAARLSTSAERVEGWRVARISGTGTRDCCCWTSQSCLDRSTRARQCTVAREMVAPAGFNQLKGGVSHVRSKQETPTYAEEDQSV